MKSKAKRLYEQFQPDHYELLLHPDAESLNFTGRVTIHGKKTGRPSQRITLHQKGLKVTKTTVTRHDKKSDQEIIVSRINNQNSMYEVRLHTDEQLYAGMYTISLEFEGKITPSMSGMYASRFTDEGNEKVIMATQFESHHAREAFPCIDEPEAKATFDLSVVAPKHHTVLSNTPQKEQKTLSDTFVTHTFETTPRMSTYLLAFVSGELHSYDTKTKSGIEVRSWSSVAQPKSHLEYSAKEAAAVLDFFADYFGVPYPLKKLDQMALPDFDSAAMENWGLVTYREMALLVDPKNRSISSEQFISLVISHELSHQWFGNLVTMKWWDDLWLNESFAGLMEHVAPAVLHPDWQQWELYAQSDIALITSRDSYRDIQSVAVEVTDPDLIPTLFDPAIVYAKGARLLKMLREYIGEETFLAGLKAYFTEHAYSNATRDDLWKALSQASGKDIGAFMTPWLTQSGMPVVHVTQKASDLTLTQERFLLDGPADNTLWPVPLLADQTTKPEIFSTKTQEIKLGSDQYVLINQLASGQYLTHYSEPKHRDYIAKCLEKASIATEARINLLNDMYMLARHGDSSLTESLDMIQKMDYEPRDAVWGLLLRVLSGASQLTEGHKTSEENLKILRANLAQHWYKKLGWDNAPDDEPNTEQLRHTMIALMIASEDKKAIEQALELYQSNKKFDDIPAEIRNTILAAAVRHGQSKVIDQLIVAYQTASAEIQHDITGALASTKNPKVAQRVIHEALGPKGFVRPQDLMRWLALFLRNHHVRSVMWEFMVTEWKWLAKTLQDSKSFDYLPTYAASIVSTPEWQEKYQALFKPLLKDKTLERNIRIGLADIEARVAWRIRDEEAIKQWLAEFTKAQAKNL